MSSDYISTLAKDRQDAIQRWLASSIGDCVVCSGPVLVCHPHKISEGGFQHLDCANENTNSRPSPESLPKSAAANARRSDWG
jgi:hypothetical protein